MAKQKKLNPHKALLIERSIEAKELKKIRIAQAETEIEHLAALALCVNDILMEWHIKETGQTEFRTFHDWKKEGFKVKKGENSYRIWGKPRKCKKSVEAVDVKTNEEKTIEEEYKLFPMCCLFHRGQVEPLETAPEPLTELEAVEDTPELPALEEAPQEQLEAVESPFVCSDFEGKQDARRDRFEQRAIKKKSESDAQYQYSKSLVEHIPMGQPILVGHHSEVRHRRTLDKSWNAMGKSVALDNHASHLQSKAESVGTGGIASDDPEALIKLTQKLDSLVESQELMKKVNKQYRAGGWDAVDGLSEKQKNELKSMMARVSYITKPFESYALSNNNAEIRRIKQRIKDQKALYSMEPINYESSDFDMFVDEGRIRIKFHHGKPAADVRQLMNKSYSFKFSRYSSEWVRKATINAIHSARDLLEKLQTIDPLY